VSQQQAAAVQPSAPYGCFNFIILKATSSFIEIRYLSSQQSSVSYNAAQHNMAYHKLPDVQHAIRWVEVVLGEPGCCNGDPETLRNGVLFCRLAATLLDHCIDLSQVRKQGNAETTTLHNLSLLYRSLLRYNIKIPSKLQVEWAHFIIAIF
jgi:hypothetical protein